MTSTPSSAGGAAQSDANPVAAAANTIIEPRLDPARQPETPARTGETAEAAHALRVFSGVARQPLVLLVDDQFLIAEAIRRLLEPHDDVLFHFCNDPARAIDIARAMRPTVILQDLVMPGANGFDLVRRYRADPATADVPIIVLSSRDDAATKAEAFSSGASDYLVKLPDPIELVARLRSHTRAFITTQERNVAFGRLTSELATAALYVRQLLPPPLTEGPVTTDWRFIPSASLGGDAFDYRWIDNDHFSMLLLDVCGHGVGPALLSLSVINLLRAGSLPGVDPRYPDRVLSALNEAFQMKQHKGMYFTAWYGVYKKSDRTLRYAGAGHPPALLLPKGHAGNPQQLESEGMFVGIGPGGFFPATTVTVEPGSQLYIYSDGIFEIAKGDGAWWGITDFIDTLGRLEPSASSTGRIEMMLNLTRQLHEGRPYDDDVSLVELTFE